jgi:hypothetical protein
VPQRAVRDCNDVLVAVKGPTGRGRSGVWLPLTASSEGNEALVWEENGITYSLISDALSLDEMLKAAESLGQ